jgi:syntaxin 8
MGAVQLPWCLFGSDPGQVCIIDHRPWPPRACRQRSVNPLQPCPSPPRNVVCRNVLDQLYLVVVFDVCLPASLFPLIICAIRIRRSSVKLHSRLGHSNHLRNSSTSPIAMATNPPQLFLLADHIKLSLLERKRAISLNLPSTSQDAQISRSLEQLRSGIESLQSQVEDTSDEYVHHPSIPPASLTPPRAISSQLPRLKSQLSDLTSQFDQNTTTTSSNITSPNNPSLQPDFTAAQKKPRPASKSVRFSDADDTPDSNRAQLFPYRDDPSQDPENAPDQSGLDNQQIHTYHSQVLRDQDDQLDQLGLSIGRQRQLSEQIGEELEGQVLLLDDVEEGVDRHQAQFVRARGRLDRFSRKARENWSLTVIIVLIIILLLLIVITK